jgi:hypothetical protein
VKDNGEGGSDLAKTVVRVCPACCTVNPSGPSTTCPHVQLARFEGIGGELEALLAEVATARRTYNELNARLKAAVLEAVREGAAIVETPRKPGRSLDDSFGPAIEREQDLNLAPSERGSGSPERSRPAPRRRRTGAPAVDSRQLTLLAFSPPKGDA